MQISSTEKLILKRKRNRAAEREGTKLIEIKRACVINWEKK